MIKDNFSIFGLPIFKSKIDKNDYDRDNLLSIITENYQKNNYRNKYDLDSNLHHSYKDESNTLFNEINFDLLKIQYKKIFDNYFNSEFISKINFNFDFRMEGYCVISNNQYMTRHQHLPNTDFSFVHYLQINQNDTPIRFHNNNDFSKYYKYIRKDTYEIADESNLSNSYMFEYVDMFVREDDMLIFPSVLEHEIPKYNNEKSKDIRVSIVGNIELKKI